jgi:hypothetical protein
MKTAFVTEMNFNGTIPSTHLNMRTEFAWMCALNSVHYPFYKLSEVSSYDHVFVIIPKGRVFLSADGSKIIDGKNPTSHLLESDLVEILRKNGNRKIHFVQEGPAWWPSDYTVTDQFLWYNAVDSMDSIFCHNHSDISYYRGLFPNKPVNVISSLMIEDTISKITPVPQEKVIIGGNFSRFYGGFNSYVVSDGFVGHEKYTMESHSKREDEELISDLKHLPRLMWTDWMRELSTFKYAVHLMPTVAAGTLSLNCGFLKIPCIGNYKMDTQSILFPELSVDVEDIQSARTKATKLYEDVNFYEECRKYARDKYQQEFRLEIWQEKMTKILKELL